MGRSVAACSRLQMRDKAGNALAAVRADDIRAGCGQRLGRLLGRVAHHGAVFVFAAVEDHAGHDRQTGFPRRLDGQLGFLQIGHGFDHEPIARRPAASACACSVKAACSSSSVTSPFMSNLPLGPIEAKTGRGRSRRLSEISTPRALIFACTLPAACSGQPNAVSAKGVGEDDLAAGLDIGLRHFRHALGMPQVPEVGEFAQPEPARLQLGAPGAVGDDRPVGQQVAR